MRNSILAALAALLLLPAAASADQVTFGSSLAGRPDIEHHTNKADTLFFNVTPQNSLKSPVAGVILEVRVKGSMNPRPGGIDANNQWNVFHTQVIRDNGGGAFTVDSSSQMLHFPVGGSPDEVHTFVPSTQCVKQGEYIAFNHFGGWNGDPAQTGARYQIFKTDPSSQMYWYERDQGTNNGSTFTANQQRDTAGNLITNGHGAWNGYATGQPRGEELMMQVVVGTGFDSTNLCEGGLQGFEYHGVEVRPLETKVYDDGVGRVRLFCSNNTHGACRGTVRLESDGVVLGQSGEFTINPTDTTNINVPLSNEGARIVNTRGKVTATVVADTGDDLGQRKTDGGTTTLVSARPTPGGFAGTTVKPQSAGAKKGVAQIKATCPRGTEGSCTGTITLVTQKRIFGRGFGGRRGSLPKIAAGKYTIEAGHTIRVPVKVSSKGTKLLKTAKSVVTVATVNSTDGAGRPVSKRVKVVLKRR
jgi:hypothetical protein